MWRIYSHKVSFGRIINRIPIRCHLLANRLGLDFDPLWDPYCHPDYHYLYRSGSPDHSKYDKPIRTDCFLGSNLTLGYIDWKEALIGSLVGGGFLFLLVVLSRGAAMGMGDVKLMAVLGLFLGWRNILLTLLLSFILGGIFGVFLLLLKRKGRKDAIPFGPWIALAAVVTILFGNEILAWYFQFL